MTITSNAGRLLVSAIVVAILSVQAVASFVDTGRWGWPLLAYPMYETAHYEGERLDFDLTAYAILADATRVELDRSDLEMDFWLYWYNVVQPIRHGSLDTLEPVLQRYCKETAGQVTQLRVEDQGWAIGRDGPIKGLPPQVMFEMDVTCK